MLTRKPKRDAEKTRARLLSCAEHLFVKNGYHDVGVDEIAGAAKVNKRMIYVYFGSKRALYDEVISGIFERLDKMDVTAEESISDYTARLKAILRVYFNFLRDNPYFVRLLSWETLYADKESIQQLVAKAYKMVVYLVDLLNQGREAGCIKPGVDIRYLAMAINSQFISFFANRMLSEETWKDDFSSAERQDEVFTMFVDLFFNGAMLPCPVVPGDSSD